jgi:hypothetical protein
MTLRALSGTQVPTDGSCLLVFTGPAYHYVQWTLSGSGTLTILNQVTDAQGVALARYNPGTAGDTPTVSVHYVP